MTNAQRLDQFENELETVKRLLVSTASYAESANRKIDQLATKVDQLTEAQTQTQSQLNQLSQLSAQSQARVDQLFGRVDEFVFQAQRLFTQQAQILERVDGRTESLEVIVRRLDRNYQEQKSQFQEFQRTTNAAIERIERILDYLVRQQGRGEG